MKRYHLILADHKKLIFASIVALCFSFGLAAVTYAKYVESGQVVVANTTKKDSQNTTDSKQQTSDVAQDEQGAKNTTKTEADAAKNDATVGTDGNAQPLQQKTTPAAAPVSPASQGTPSVSLRGRALYVDPSYAQAGRPSALASQPIAVWFGGWNTNVEADVNAVVSSANAKGQLAQLVLYNIPARDCSGYSAGGAESSAQYRSWIRSVARGIGNREAIVILEPDSLAQITCLSSAGQAARYADLADAVSVFASTTRAYTYLDGGHSSWVAASTMVSRLQKANIAQAQGFALNVANYMTTASNIAYGNQLHAIVKKSFVIDTSRNGRGSNGEWCNARGRALGERPTTATQGNVDAYLWVKRAGESDGTCGGGPAAGEWWSLYADELIRNSS